jgi:hypothetical protein
MKQDESGIGPPYIWRSGREGEYQDDKARVSVCTIRDQNSHIDDASQAIVRSSVAPSSRRFKTKDRLAVPEF